MSQSDETDKPFTVSDRRHFTPEGRPRDNGEASAPPDAGKEEKPSPPLNSATEAGRTEAPSPEEPERAPAGPADLSQFVIGVAAQAAAFLSGEGLPQDVSAGEALEGARSMIAVLEMLKLKTAGNLSEPEAALLENLLFQLRMAYVEKSRAGGA